MSQFEKKTIDLNIAPNEKNDWLDISVFDAKNNLVARQSGTFNQSLPTGLYMVVSELSGSTTETIIKHVSSETVKIDVPKVRGVQEKVEHAKIATEQSAQEHITLLADDEIKDFNARLFVFCHTTTSRLNKEVADFCEHLSLFTDQNERILDMNLDDWKLNDHEGWMAFQTYLKPGLYFFNYRKGATNRSFPLVISRGFQTQLILPLNKRPDFNAVQIGMSAGETFASGAKGITGFEAFQIAETKLLNNDFELPKNILSDLINDKWSNPFYGIIVCYLYLMNDKHDRDNLIETVLRNLSTNIFADSEHPDVRILDILFKEHMGIPLSSVDKRPFEKVPMLKAGFNQLVRLSFKYPSLIQEGSIVDLVSGRLRYNTIWTCFKPPKFAAQSRNIIAHKKTTNRSLFTQIKSTFSRIVDNFDNIKDLISDFLPAIMELRWGDQAIEPHELAKHVGIPYVTLKRKIQELNALILEHPQLIEKIVDYLSERFDEDVDQEVVEVIRTLAKQMEEEDSDDEVT